MVGANLAEGGALALALALMVPVAVIATWLAGQTRMLRRSMRSATGRPPSDLVLDRSAWNRRMHHEASRCGRYERSAAVVVIRLDVFDRLVAAAEATDRGRLCRAISASLRRATRDSDVVFGERTGTFRILLLEADERGARAYVERAAQVLRPWVETVGARPGLTAVWADTSELIDLPAADRLSEARLVGARAGWIRSSFVWRT